MDYSDALPFLGSMDPTRFQNELTHFHHIIQTKAGPGRQGLGWLDFPVDYDRQESFELEEAAAKIRQESDVLLVIGIGGSFMGARAAIEMLTHSFNHDLPKEARKRGTPQIFFVGHHLDPTYMADLMDILQGKDFSINVISKSGGTLEPAIAFRMFRQLLEDKYGPQQAASRIYVTTDREIGTLKALAMQEGYKTFPIPRTIGGRYSVLTAVGLLPMAVSGIGIGEVLEGAATARSELKDPAIENNPAYQYAAIRNSLYRKGKTTELLVSYDPRLQSFAEWWKQLFGESEGKNLQGIFPVTALYTTDLHAIGQYIQQGRRMIFETTLKVEKPLRDLIITERVDDQDELNYLSGNTLGSVNDKAFQGTLRAHTEGGIPNLVIGIPKITPFSFGYLVYFFQLACVMSSYILGVNPFDQPGVEAYKNNMFRLLGKPE
ncbi:glucose-6-phosphate isomerase [Sporosarcina sp. 179-K 3D1 HS]|uniref:glucose-6-phosphate isomerase n=1 Tax=Sporosarcina sp. 179-K 3D1 HS TaxID=3232169 RepID=UPI0039A1CF47